MSHRARPPEHIHNADTVPSLPIFLRLMAWPRLTGNNRRWSLNRPGSLPALSAHGSGRTLRSPQRPAWRRTEHRGSRGSIPRAASGRVLALTHPADVRAGLAHLKVLAEPDPIALEKPLRLPRRPDGTVETARMTVDNCLKCQCGSLLYRASFPWISARPCSHCCPARRRWA